MHFEKQVFTTDVTLDYNEFVDCEFKNCKIFYHGGPFSVVNGKFSQVSYMFGGDANNTLGFLRMLHSITPQLIDELLKPPSQPSDARPILN